MILNRCRFPVADVAEDPLVKPELALLHTAADGNRAESECCCSDHEKGADRTSLNIIGTKAACR